MKISKTNVLKEQVFLSLLRVQSKRRRPKASFHKLNLRLILASTGWRPCTLRYISIHCFIQKPKAIFFLNMLLCR